MTIQQIKNFISTTNLPKELRLNKATFINDVLHFFETHLSIIQGNGGRNMKMPYYDRMLEAMRLIHKLNGNEQVEDIVVLKEEPAIEQTVKQVEIVEEPKVRVEGSTLVIPKEMMVATQEQKDLIDAHEKLHADEQVKRGYVEEQDVEVIEEAEIVEEEEIQEVATQDAVAKVEEKFEEAVEKKEDAIDFSKVPIAESNSALKPNKEFESSTEPLFAKKETPKVQVMPKPKTDEPPLFAKTKNVHKKKESPKEDDGQHSLF